MADLTTGEFEHLRQLRTRLARLRSYLNEELSTKAQGAPGLDIDV